ncbi:GTP-binding protein rhoA [Serendipita vermifera]|nr:GTP-binding protein rhoA [Serendipita vermifera]
MLEFLTRGHYFKYLIFENPGKTCLLTKFQHGQFPQTFMPTSWESYVVDIEVKNRAIGLALWDTAGQEDYDRLRTLSYPSTDVVLICFSLDYPASLENVEQKWVPEIAHFCPGVPFILVGCKADLRHDRRTVEDLKRRGEEMISSEYGEVMSRRIGANAYLECSAKSGEGVNQVVQTAAMVICSSPPRIQRKECLLV